MDPQQSQNVFHTQMFYFSPSPEQFIWIKGMHFSSSHYRAIYLNKGNIIISPSHINVRSEEVLCCCYCQVTLMYMWERHGMFLRCCTLTCGWKIAAFLHKQLERLQGLDELHRGVDTVITAVIISLGLCVCVLTGDSSNDSNSVKWVVLYVTKRVKERL